MRNVLLAILAVLAAVFGLQNIHPVSLTFVVWTLDIALAWALLGALVLGLLLGAALMGFGGVTAMGCTVGQGITGFSTLALGSMLTFLAIIAGAVAMLKFQYWRIMREA